MSEIKSTVLTSVESRTTINYAGFKFRKYVRLLDNAVYFAILPPKSDEIIFDAEINDYTYITDLLETELQYALNNWLMDNTTEQERIYAALDSWNN